FGRRWGGTGRYGGRGGRTVAGREPAPAPGRRGVAPAATGRGGPGAWRSGSAACWRAWASADRKEKPRKCRCQCGLEPSGSRWALPQRIRLPVGRVCTTAVARSTRYRDYRLKDLLTGKHSRVAAIITPGPCRLTTLSPPRLLEAFEGTVELGVEAGDFVPQGLAAGGPGLGLEEVVGEVEGGHHRDALAAGDV